MDVNALFLIGERLKEDFGLAPVVGAEIEFYLPGATPQQLKRLETETGFMIEKEKGDEQYEIALPPYANPSALARAVAQLKKTLPADFSPRPYADRPGSGLHIHLHLEDGAGKNVFSREGEDYSAPLRHAIGGMLALMQESMVVFAPRPESYARFAEKSNAPLSVSWGPNNRTVAIRLPNAPMEHKRIEHRVAGADADPALVLVAVLAAAHYGLMHRTDPGEPVHGDAALPVYGRERLIRDCEVARECFEQSGRLRNYLRPAAS